MRISYWFLTKAAVPSLPVPWLGPPGLVQVPPGTPGLGVAPGPGGELPRFGLGGGASAPLGGCRYRAVRHRDKAWEANTSHQVFWKPVP